MIPPEITRRLRQLLLMMSSTHDGEILNAVRMVDRLLKSNGCDWHDLVANVEEQKPFGSRGQSQQGQSRRPPPPPPPNFDEEDKLLAEIIACQDTAGALTEWEKEFLQSIREQMEYRGTLTERQQEVLTRIARKCAWHRKQWGAA